MTPYRLPGSLRLFAWICLFAGMLAGCRANTLNSRYQLPGDQPSAVAREQDYVQLPEYRLEPPDIILIDALRIVPREPFRIEALDILYVQVEGTFEDQPINGQFSVSPNGAIDLGPAYGRVKVAGLSIDEAIQEVEKFLSRTLREPQVSITLLLSGGQAQIAGQRLVGPDGYVNLGTYGMVYVAGSTISEAQEKITEHLQQYLQNPIISVDIFAYNSKVYYVVSEGAGSGDNLQRFPITGKETVLDAIANVGGLSRFSDKRIWIARPAPSGQECDQVLPVQWNDIVRGGQTATNYQLMPGDRVFIAEEHMSAVDSRLTQLFDPLERILGVTILGSNVVATGQRFPGGLQGQNNPGF
ncbi:MAG: polysaccharide biosynthesis/export family protein [Pirellulales bacterium]|nr:polysaccharide biosynthesis/export family protein [Pirellulales bacterium]